MLKKILKENMGTSNLGWLESRFHFSFAQYYNPQNMNFGLIRVVNDDVLHPNSGFDTHPHKDMEIITYVIDGELTHEDSLGNKEILHRGEVQYLSAGDGILHSEHNMHKSKDLRLLQIWILPPQLGLPKLYGSFKYKEENRKNKLLNIVSSLNGNSQIKIYQDVNIYSCELEKEKKLNIHLVENMQIYFIQIEGQSNINGNLLELGDAAKITNENNLNIEAIKDSHFLFIEMLN
jgi:quercetin 2,3-dioxygenase